MDTLMPYEMAVRLLAGNFVLLFIHIMASHLFFLRYMERIEAYLSDIEMIGLHRSYYGDSWFGRRMRETFITLILVWPSALKKQEVIPAHKIKKLPAPFRFCIRFFFYSAMVLLAAIGLFELRLEVWGDVPEGY
jgi:hypothetical protein